MAVIKPVRRSVVWLKEAGAELADVELAEGRLTAIGTAIGADPLPYRLSQITSSDGQAAAARIAGRVRRTPVAEVGSAPFASTRLMWLKLEYMQHAGSFKTRGVFNLWGS